MDVAFTDSTLDLQGLRPAFENSLPELEEASGERVARLKQVHGDTVLVVDRPGPEPTGQVPTADALVTTTPGLGLMVRVADCVPVVLADPRTGVLGADGHWGDYTAIVPMAPSGMDATAPHLTWDNYPLQQNESTFFEIAGAHLRYHCPQSRTLFIGKPPQKYLDAEKAVLESIEAGLEQAKPGNRCEDIANAFNATLNKFGFVKENRCGYAIGMSYPPDWGERTMSFRRGDMSVLKPGMTFHFMPALWLDDGGVEITEPILITETGVECLCTTPRQLFVKD